MTTVRVFDPAMCCSTGICGPSVDPQLVRFAADLDWLRHQGVVVERFNLSQQPAAFAEDAAAKAALAAGGESGLPLVKVNGEVKSSGVFPSRAELAAWAGVSETREEGTPGAKAGGCGSRPRAAAPAAATEPLAEESAGCCGAAASTTPGAHAVPPKTGGCC